MALKAGYKGIKKSVADKLNSMSSDDTFATDTELDERIAEVAIKTGTVTGTTTSSANILLTSNKQAKILGAWDAVGHIVIPYKTAAGNNNAHVINASTLEPASEAEVNITFYYV